MNDWNNWAVGAVVAVTLLLFIRRMLRPKKGCGGGCDCDGKR